MTTRERNTSTHIDNALELEDVFAMNGVNLNVKL